MPDERDSSRAIIGDVEAVTELRVNTKGGSTTAILKKALREPLGELGDHLSAAVLRFADGHAIALLSAGFSGPFVRVHRIGKDRFEIELDTGSDQEIDDVTMAFLTLKESRFKTGDLPLMEPVNADQWGAEMDEKLSAAHAAADQLSRASKSTG